MGEAICAYAWYYLWDWGRHGWRQKIHLAFVWLAAGCALMAMFMIDITASYMLTPDPIYNSWANIFNPTMIHLDLHRWLGNLTWAGFAIAGICAIGYLTSKTESDRNFFEKAEKYSFIIGYGALLVMPVVGYQDMLHLRYGQPQAFYTVMLGERSWLFALVGMLYGMLVLVGSLYIAPMVRSQLKPALSFSGFLPFSLAIIVLAALTLAMPYHLQHVPLLNQVIDQEVNPLGKMQPYKYFALSGLVIFGFVNWLYSLRVFWQSRAQPKSASGAGVNRLRSSTAITLAGLTIIILLAMGWVRDSARAINGYLIYDVMRLNEEESTYQGSASGKDIFSKDLQYDPFPR